MIGAARSLLGAGATFLPAPTRAPSPACGRNGSAATTGAARFYRSIPLEDIYPPPAHPHVDPDDPAPFAVYFTIRAEDGAADVWLRIDGGPMQTAYRARRCASVR